MLDRSGIPKLLPVILNDHLDRMEEFLAKAERVVDHAQAGTLPDYINDPGECRRCDFFGATCNPPMSAGGAVVLTDPELEAALTRREELKAAADEFDKIDKRVKAQLRGIEEGIAGPFVINGKWQKKTTTDLPADVKKLYSTTDPKGSFRLEIVRLDGPARPMELGDLFS